VRSAEWVRPLAASFAVTFTVLSVVALIDRPLSPAGMSWVDCIRLFYCRANEGGGNSCPMAPGRYVADIHDNFSLEIADSGWHEAATQPEILQDPEPVLCSTAQTQITAWWSTPGVRVRAWTTRCCCRT
jgi:hypothetical protein